MSEPSVGNNRYNSGEELEYTKTVQERREANEREYNRLRTTNLQEYFNLSTRLEQAYSNLDYNSARDICNKKEQLLEEYANKRIDGSRNYEQINKEIAEKLAEYAIQKERDVRKEQERAELEYQAMVRSGEEETENEILRIKKQNLSAEYKEQLDYLEKVKQGQIEASDEQVEASKKAQEEIRKQLATTYGVDQNNPLKGLVTGQGDVRGYYEELAGSGDTSAQMMVNGFDALENSMNKLLNSWSSMFESIISSYSSYQTIINTRLQGSGQTWNGTYGIENTLSRVVGDNAYIELTDLMENVSKAVQAGIAYNIEQRAFLETISDEIAATFDAFDSSLLQLIRLQQSDTTASRLGMEASLTQFYNSLFSDSSYLSDQFDNVSSSLIDAMSLMTAEQGVEFEYTVQKWLGSLYSVGFDSGSINSLADALNRLGSGDISDVSGTAMGKLLLQAANQGGLDISSMIVDGLDASETNELLKSMVEFLEQIATSESNLTLNQLANLYGLSVSDITAAANLAGSVDLISSTTLSYAGTINELYNQMDQISSRVSVGQQMSNLLSNVQYSMGANIASNPATYALWEITSMIEGLTGGINLPTVSVMGNAVDLNTTVTNLMRSGIVGVSTLGAIGDIINGVNATINPSSMLEALGITSTVSTTTRGTSVNTTGKLTGEASSSTMIGNASGEDYYQQALTSANEQTSTTLQGAMEESEAATLDDINEYLLEGLDPQIAMLVTNTEAIANALASTTVTSLIQQSSSLTTSSILNGLQITVSLDNEENLTTNAENIKNIRDTLSDVYGLLSGVITNGVVNVRVQSETTGLSGIGFYNTQNGGLG